MVDAISTNNPVANVAIPATPITPSQSVGTSAPIQSQPSVDQVSISPQAQIAAREVFSERPDINVSQAQVADTSVDSNAAIGQAANVESTEPETVTVPPADTNSAPDNTESRNDAEENNPLSDLVEL